MVTYIFGLAILLAGCDAQVSDKSDRQLAELALEAQNKCEKGRCPCETPLGSIEHGSKVTTYSQGTAECNEGCGKFSTELTCENGKLIKQGANGSAVESIDGKFFKCTVLECPSCRLGENLIRNGEKITAYSDAEVGCRESCEDYKQERTCEMGVLSGSDTFANTSCKAKICRCELPDSNSYLSLDGKITLFNSEQAVCGRACSSYALERTCSVVGSGANETYALNGSSAYRYRQCQEPQNCFCTLPNNLGVVAHGDTQQVWNAASVGCGQSCTTVPSVVVKCENGVFKNNANLSQTVDFGSAAFSTYKYQCSSQACVTCPIPGTSTRIEHGETWTFAKQATVACSENCDTKVRTCNNGTFSGDTTYNASSCSKRQCTCDVPNKPGVTVPIGSTWSFYSAAVPQCSQTCSQISSNKTCTEVNTNGNYSYVFQGSSAHTLSSCSPPTNCACPLPGNLGAIENLKSVTLTSQAVVPCGKSCSEIPSVNVTCGNGILIRTDDQSIINASDPTYPYKYFCNQATCQACPLRGYGSIPNGTSTTLYAKNVLTCSDSPEALTFAFACENGKLLRNGAAYNPDTDPNAPAAWYTSYSVNCPGCNLPWGGFVAEGGSVNAYKFFGTVINNCGRGCKVQQRTCKMGALDGDPSFDMASCNNSCTMEGGGAPPRACLLPWQNSYITPDAQIPIWKKRQVPCGESCQSHFALARCDMKAGNFGLSFDYIYPTCTELCAD